MQTSTFMVHREPYCLWGHDIKERNVQFLEGLDADYFEFVTQLALDARDEKRASALLFANLHHAIEMLFSLLGAYVQAPDCVYAWIPKCSNSQLRSLVDEIGNGDNSIIRKLRTQTISWEEIAKSVCAYFPYEDSKKNATANGFAKTWKRLASEFVSEMQIDQYNSLKHGMRVSRGGFRLSFGAELASGVEPTEFHDLGGSEYGLTFYKVRDIWPSRKSRSIKCTKTSVNWSIDRVVGQLFLVQCSIQNIVSALKAVNGVPVAECKFVRPELDDDFDRPWTHICGVSSSSMDFIVDTSNTIAVTPEQIIETFKEP